MYNMQVIVLEVQK